MGRPKGSKSKLGRKEMLTARVPKKIVKDLNNIARFNNTDKTTQVERFLREGIERSRRILKKRYVVFSMMILTLASIGLYIWYLFNI